MLIQIKDNQGNIYSNDMSQDKAIIEMHFCTSYTECLVQDKLVDQNGNITYPKKTIIIPCYEENDFLKVLNMAAGNDDEIGLWVQ